MHPSSCPSCGFIHFKTLTGHLQLAKGPVFGWCHVKDTCSTHRGFTVEAASITTKKDCQQPWCGLGDQVVTLGSHQTWLRGCGAGEVTWGWKHLGVSDTGQGKGLCPGTWLHSLDLLGGGWFSGGWGVCGAQRPLSLPLCSSSVFLGPPAALWWATWSWRPDGSSRNVLKMLDV